jgi:drug/metabolite transporter (DMT)-like permease
MHPTVLLILAMAAILYPIQTHIYYKAMKMLPLSTFGMLSGIVPLSAMIFSVLLRGSHISIYGLLGILLTVSAIAVLSYKNQSLEMSFSTLAFAICAYSLF